MQPFVKVETGLYHRLIMTSNPHNEIKDVMTILQIRLLHWRLRDEKSDDIGRTFGSFPTVPLKETSKNPRCVGSLENAWSGDSLLDLESSDSTRKDGPYNSASVIQMMKKVHIKNSCRILFIGMCSFAVKFRVIHSSRKDVLVQAAEKKRCGLKRQTSF